VPPCASSPSWSIVFFQLFFFISTTLLTRMTGISSHVQWPLTYQLHNSFSQREQLFFIVDQTSRPKVSITKLIFQSAAMPWSRVTEPEL
jgi:hypothetical protein